METTALMLLGAILVLLGLAGLLVPAIPGAPLMFAGLVVAAWAEDFEYVGTGLLLALAALALFTYLVDIVAGVMGVRRFGASPTAMTGALVGACVGIFFGLPGIIVGPFVGAAIGEFLKMRDLPAAGRAGVGATVGLIVGTAAKLALAFMMLGLYAAARLL